MGLIGLVATTAGLSPNAAVKEALRLMHDRKVGAVAVAQRGKLAGIFTYRDLVERVLLEGKDPAGTKLGEVMTRDVDALEAENSYGEALRLMVANEYTYLPIVGPERRLLGMLSLRELLQHRIDDLANELDSIAKYYAVDGPGGD